MQKIPSLLNLICICKVKTAYNVQLQSLPQARRHQIQNGELDEKCGGEAVKSAKVMYRGAELVPCLYWVKWIDIPLHS